MATGKKINKRLRNKKARNELKRTTGVTTLSGARVHNANYGGGLSKGDFDGPSHSPVRKSKSRKPFYLEARRVKPVAWWPGEEDPVGKWKKWFGRYKTRKSGEQGLASAQKSWYSNYYEFRLREEGVEIDDTQQPETEQEE